VPSGEQPPLRVLVADDHGVCRAGLVELMERAAGLTVVGVAADGQEAVELSAEQRPDVVLMDIEMPRLNGIEATRLLVGSAHAPRVLVITSMANRERIREALAAGACGYLFKDAEPGDLLEAVRAAGATATAARSEA
jgi:DNA-binding NarL/FixJ family response regulator